MATWQVVEPGGQILDAHLKIEGADIVLESRGGSRQHANMRNSDYGPALRLILERLRSAGLTVEEAWVDSGRVQYLQATDRVIFGPQDRHRSPAEQFQLLSSRMKTVGRTAIGPGGNSTKRIRIRVLKADAAMLEAQLGVRRSNADFRSAERLSAELLSRVQPADVWTAVDRLLAGEEAVGFGPSTDFDMLTDGGARLPPKAVFGLAASQALGFPVLPKHFVGGLGTLCFRAIEAAGFSIVPKSEIEAQPSETSQERGWTEGNPKLSYHLWHERGRGLAEAKRRDFIRRNGRLFCERCGLDPLKTLGPDGLACIEVHHALIPVAQMGEDHETRLEDLQCLCANCHRMVHAALRRAVLKREEGCGGFA